MSSLYRCIWFMRIKMIDCKSSLLLVDRKYQKGQSSDNHLILLFNLKYKSQLINVILQQDKYNSNAMS